MMADKEKGLHRYFKYFFNLQFVIAMASLCVLIILNLYEIIMRGFFNRSFIWIQDISVLLMCWMIFPGFSKIAYDKKDIVISFIYDKLNKSFRTVFVNIILQCLIIFFTVVFTIFSYKLLLSQRGQGTITAKIPLVYYTASVFLGAFSLFIINFQDLLNTLLSFIKGKRG